VNRPIVGALVGGVIAMFAVAGCGGDHAPSGPIVGRIDDALDAVEIYYGAPQKYYEVSATSEFVEVIVVTEDGGEQAFWAIDDGLTEPVQIDVPDRPIFERGDVDFDPDTVLDALGGELPESEIVDFAVTGAGGGAVVYDARVQSQQGGVLLVLLGSDGSILGAQAE